jgi:hypothetical protein
MSDSALTEKLGATQDAVGFTGWLADGVCPVCKGIPVEPAVKECHGCMACDFHGTRAGYEQMQRLEREAYESAEEITDDDGSFVS